MKIALYSDLHLEFSPWTMPETQADVIIFAGDIGVGKQGAEFVSDVARSNPSKQIIYVPGNHEYYGSDFESVESEIINTCRLPNLYEILNEFVILDGVVFYGGTMWTNLQSRSISEIKNVMRGLNDFSQIKDMSAQRWQEAHNDFVFCLNETCRVAEQQELPMVVISHHLPSPRSVPLRFISSGINGGFMEDMTRYFTDPIKLWCHGHTHNACDYVENGVRVICNPRGYPIEQEATFNPYHLIELET